jgi:hypothetical protein
MFRSSVLSLAVAIVLPIGCGSVSDEGLFGPPDPSLWTGAKPSAGGAVGSGGSGGVGGLEASGGVAAGGIAETGGSTGGVSTSGISQTGGTGGLDPSTGGSSAEIGSPGVVSCMGIPCRSDMSPANTCCLGATSANTRCQPEIVPCAFYGASAFHCDDRADCGGGAICCGTLTDGLVVADCVTECSTTGNTLQLCRTQGECPEGRECKPWSKLPEFSVCQ